MVAQNMQKWWPAGRCLNLFSCYTPLCLPFLLLKFGLVVFLCMTCLFFFFLFSCVPLFFLEGERRSTCVIYPAINFIVNRYFSVACFFVLTKYFVTSCVRAPCDNLFQAVVCHPCTAAGQRRGRRYWNFAQKDVNVPLSIMPLYFSYFTNIICSFNATMFFSG